MEPKGYVQIYTGGGKGKTTAAVGLAIRALGAGKKILFVQFMKSWFYSEQKILGEISENLKLELIGKPFFVARKEDIEEGKFESWHDECVVFEKDNPPEQYVRLCTDALKRVAAIAKTDEYDLIVLDEINVAVFFQLVREEDVLEMMRSRHEKVELVLTGRNASEKMIEAADLVTEMKEIKHYYTEKGIEARHGVEN